MNQIAIIGTAGRDKTKPMTIELWLWMLRDAYSRVPKGAHGKSGGAAWADHLVVSMFLFGHLSELTLHLPAPFENGRFVDSGFKSAGSAANYYHGLFSAVIDRNTLGQIAQAIAMGAHVTYEPAAPNVGGMFARNAKVANTPNLLAYTFGEGDVPADGGTLDTWNKCQGNKIHISLPHLK